ncbi:MAG: hypothetical protein ACFFA1_02200 [Promethearchaeota archaeon]
MVRIINEKEPVEDEEEFWLQPPWTLLTDVVKLSKVSPWNIDLDELVRGFLEKMLTLNLVNFRVSGIALLSASILYRMKTELALSLGEEKDVSELYEEFKLLPPIRPPFRLISRKVTIDELLIALEDALRQEVESKKRKVKTKAIELEIPDVIYEVEPDKAEIEKTLTLVYEKIRTLSHNGEAIRFSQLISEGTRTIIVRTFVCILLLSFRGMIDIWQDEPFGEIFIKLLEEGGPDNE